MANNLSPAYINFLHSPTVSLQATKSDRPFHIHRDLLASKSKTIFAAFDCGFQEDLKGVYTFQDTLEGTLARFIEWAYTGDYPAVTARAQQTGLAAKIEEDDEAQNNTAARGVQLIPAPSPGNHPLPAHMRVYIFSSIYLIPDLRSLAFERVTVCFTEIDKPEDLDSQLAVIAAFRLAFGKLPQDDPLLDWLAQYAAYGIDKLRMQRDFHDLLLESPELSSRMVLSLIPGQQPPWKSPPPRYMFGKYVPGTGNEETEEEF
ncbi:hypothetical protein BJX64DRAFT_41412 [Aspergillus heterothallicus]